MKNRIFNRGLWLDGCRQMKLLGSVSAIFLMLEVILLPVYRMLQIRETNGGSIAEAYLTNRDLITLHPMAGIVIIFTVPVMTLTLFHFLNRRNACDFYHAVPLTRTCVFLSYGASVLTWMMGLLWGSTLLSVILHQILNTGTRVLYGTILVQCVALSITGLLVFGGLILAMSVTGNVFSNVIVTGMILFGPRLLMLVIQLGVGMSLTIVQDGKYLSFLGNGWNILTGYLFGFVVNNSTAADVLTAPHSMIYTLVLALFYLILGWQFYVRRSSEMAGQAAAGNGLQLIFRLAPAFLFTLIPDIVLFDEIAGNGTMDTEEYFLILILYLLAVILYFLYELISTRKVRNLKNAVPGLLILAMLDCAVIFGMLQMRESILDFCPSSEEIESVSLNASTIDVYMGDTDNTSNEYPGYLSSHAAQVALTSTNVKKIVADSLERAVEYDEGALGSEFNSWDDSADITVAITADGRTRTRVISMTRQNLEDLAAAMAEEPAVQEIYMNLPPVEDENLQLYLYGTYDNLSREAAEHVYQALQQDIQDMGFIEWYTYTSAYMYEYDTYSITNLNLRYSEGTKVTGSSIPISNMTPHAEHTYLEEVWKQQMAGVELDEALKALRQWKEDGGTDRSEDESSWANGHLMDDQDISRDYGLELSCDGVYDLLCSLLQAQSDITPTEDSVYISLDLNMDVDLDDYVVTDDSDIISQSTSTWYNLLLILPENIDMSVVNDVLFTGVTGYSE